MKKLLLGALLFSTVTSTVFAGYSQDMAYMKGQQTIRYGAVKSLDDSMKYESNWKVCIYLLEKFGLEEAGDYQRAWVQGCADKLAETGRR